MAACPSLAPVQPLMMVVVWLYYNMAIGRAEGLFSVAHTPEQVVVEVDLAVARSPCIGNTKLQAPDRQAQYSHARTILFCDPWLRSTRILYRGHLGRSRDPCSAHRRLWPGKTPL